MRDGGRYGRPAIVWVVGPVRSVRCLRCGRLQHWGTRSGRPFPLWLILGFGSFPHRRRAFASSPVGGRSRAEATHLTRGGKRRHVRRLVGPRSSLGSPLGGRLGLRLAMGWNVLWAAVLSPTGRGKRRAHWPLETDQHRGAERGRWGCSLTTFIPGFLAPSCCHASRARYPCHCNPAPGCANRLHRASPRRRAERVASTANSRSRENGPYLTCKSESHKCETPRSREQTILEP